MAKEHKKSGREQGGTSPAKAKKSHARVADVPDGPGGFGPEDRPRVVVTVDVVLLALRQGVLSVLLVERGRTPHLGSWALPGTVVGPDEQLAEAGVRAVAARTGVAMATRQLEQLAAFAEPARDPRTRVLTIGFVAVDARAVPPAGGAVASGRWWPVNEVTATGGPTLAFDHGTILAAGIEQVREDLEWSDLATAMVEEPFTLGDLRRAYEAVWGSELEPANFRRKVLTTPGFVTPTGGLRTVSTGRPAELFTRGDGVCLHPPLVRPG